ncbi:hypothetical protein EHS25_009723 [Saitozyma podzolica]|uniref:Uncharacterized protein n=1 Tax=Saitozyma podzolica TaxID=1890683 RepID=A0A427YJZ4_9TREE|nr:hypothetical protein EHS25_009723 [Saitozyma podzolica]
MHFLDYGRSHRATEFSGAISLPYEAAKWFLNLALRLVPNVSRTLAKVVFIACFALCLIDFGVWCIVTLYRVLFNKVSPDPILVTPFHPDQREELEHQARGPRFQRPSAQVESLSQSPSATACGPSLPPPVQCELSPSSSSSPSPSTPTDLSPDLASSSDTLLSSSSHSWSSGDIISSELTESSSDSSDTDSSTSEEVYIFKAYRAPKVVRPQTQGSGTLFVSAENRLGRDWAMKRRR